MVVIPPLWRKTALAPVTRTSSWMMDYFAPSSAWVAGRHVVNCPNSNFSHRILPFAVFTMAPKENRPRSLQTHSFAEVDGFGSQTNGGGAFATTVAVLSVGSQASFAHILVAAYADVPIFRTVPSGYATPAKEHMLGFAADCDFWPPPPVCARSADCCRKPPINGATVMTAASAPSSARGACGRELRMG